MEGEGELNYPKDDKVQRVSYKGNFKEGKQSGKGTLVVKTGAKYEGSFENNLYNGFGVYTYTTGRINEAGYIYDYYEGHWKDGKRSGKGKSVHWHSRSMRSKVAVKSQYEGGFENDLCNGFGFYTYPKEDSGDYYVGDWKDGKMSGQGKLVFKDGTKQEGPFENGSFKLGPTARTQKIPEIPDNCLLS